MTVVSCEKTATEGLNDTYTVTFSDGSAYTFTVGNGEKGDKGDKGDAGSSLTVVSCEKTATDGLVDTYTITFSDGSTADFKIVNGGATATVSEVSYIENGDKYKISYSDGTATEFAVSESSGATKAYNDAVQAGHSASKSEFVNSAINAAKVALLSGGSPMDAKVFGNVISAMLNDYYTYFSVDKTAASVTTSQIIENVGFMTQGGEAKPNSATQNYVYTDIIPCKPGETVEVWFNGSPLSFRFITAYKDGKCVRSASVDCNLQTIKSYVVPEGVDGVVFTYQKRNTVPEARCSLYTVMPAVLPNVSVSEVNKLYYGSGGGAQVTAKNDSISAIADTLKAGEYLKLENNHIMNAKTLTLSFKLDSLSDGEAIRLGHGESSHGGSYVELTKDNIKVYNYTNADSHAQGKDVTLNKAHGLILSGVVNITVKTRLHDADIIVTTPSGMIKERVSWAGRNGEIFATAIGTDISDVRMRWHCAAYEYDIWMLGDSYFNSGSSWRWPYYLRMDGYSEYMLMGYPGRNSASGLEDFKQALTHGTPKYAVWCLGMNNGDSGDTVNVSYLKSVQEFISICEEKGITPILSTVPCTPTVNNYHKNEWVRKSGYRYIDFARAVGGEEIGSGWYEGMLHTDNVHPNELGAKALYAQFIADFPEILGE